MKDGVQKEFCYIRITRMETTGTHSTRGSDLTYRTSENDKFTSGEVGREGDCVRMDRMKE